MTIDYAVNKTFVQFESLPYLQLTSFIGRKQEISEVKRLLMTTRLLTIVGTGGSGKTRLALQVASDLQGEFEHGITWVDLDAVTNPVLVPQAVAAALGIPKPPRRLLTDMLSDYLRPKNLLIVLDACEHLAAACSQLIEMLLKVCPFLRIMTTSRQVLNIAGETTWFIPSLRCPSLHPGSLPSPDDLIQSEAIQLFVERAMAAQPSFILTQENALAVLQICRRLDSLPLAIELAAARVKHLSIHQIVARLEDCCRLLTGGLPLRRPQHKALVTTIGWSFGSLSQQERRLFSRLSVFAGGFSIEAAEAICVDEGIERHEVLDLLSLLVDKSLVVVELSNEEARFRMLEVIRQYGLDKLQERGEEKMVRGLHRDWYMDLVKRAELNLRGTQQAVWLDQLEREHDNLRAALHWSLEQGEAEIAAQLGVGLWRFWLLRGHLSEGRRWLQNALMNLSGCTAMRARALCAAGSLALSQNDLIGARALLGESLDLWRALGVKKGIAWALSMMGTLAQNLGDYEQAQALYEECLALFRGLQNMQGLALSLSNLGVTVLCRGDCEQARALCEESLALFQELGDAWGMANALTNLALAKLEKGEYKQAVLSCQESQVLRQLLGDKRGCAHSLATLGNMMLYKGSVKQGLAFYKASQALWREIEDKAGSAILMEGWARVAVAQGSFRSAVRLYAAAEALRGPTAACPPANGRSDCGHTLAVARARLNESAFVEAWAEGRTLSPEQAIDEALMEQIMPGEETFPLPAEEIASAGDGAGSEYPELRIFALGSSQVYRGEDGITQADWRYTKARELLFYLLCHRSGTKEQIGLALWPDASTEQLRASFHSVLHRLRVALGRPEWIIFERDRYIFNRQLSYWFDVEAFESYLAQARKLQARSPTQAISYLKESIKLYRGDFLQDLAGSDWYNLHQKALRQKFLDALLTLGRLLFAEEQYAEAAEIFRELIAQDGLLEVAHRELMRCYGRQGDYSQALRHYNVLVKLLHDELGAPPAPETTELFGLLRQGRAV